MRDRGAARSTVVLVAGFLLLSARISAEDRQIRGFIGATFGAGTTLVDFGKVAGKANLVIGASAVFLGEMVGTEIEIADAPGFFDSNNNSLLRDSRVTTISGNLIVAAPRRMTEYSLRPYLVGGGGLMRIRTTTTLNVFDTSSVTPMLDVGVGVVGFLTNQTGVYWELRRFQSVGGDTGNVGLSWGDEHLSFWRATMGVAIRY
jgi:hypothetical protein